MSGPKRNPDKLNTIGVIVVGICGAVLVYVSITALQAFYMNDTSEVQTMADYGGNDTSLKSVRTSQINNITEAGTNPAAPPKPGEEAKPATYHINVTDAMKLVVDSAKVDPSMLVPMVGRSDKASVLPIYGRPKPIAAPVPPPATDPGAGSGAGSAAPAGSGSGSAAPADAGSGSGAKPSTETKPAAAGSAAGSAAKGNGK